METFQQRLKRFIWNFPFEIPETLLNSISNHFLPQLRKADEQNLDMLVFLGTHAIIQTVSEKIFGKSGLEGTKFYLEHFVDGATEDRKFSLIAEDLHSLRNSVAHSWMSSQMHRMALDYIMQEGWKLERHELHLNPHVYFEQFLTGFAAGGPIWNYHLYVTKEEFQIRKYLFIRDWLQLNRKDSISIEINKLQKLTDPQDIPLQHAIVLKLIVERYKIS
jgi:hypothetical protein